MPAAYSFRSRWALAAAPEQCWTQLERMLLVGDTSWWPGVRLERPPSGLAPGERFRMSVRSPLGYRLRTDLTIDEVVPGVAVAASSVGDLHGHGRVEIVGAPPGSILSFSWDVTTQPRWMNASAGVLRPVFEAAHARVMARGERGLRARLSPR